MLSFSFKILEQNFKKKEDKLDTMMELERLKDLKSQQDKEKIKQRNIGGNNINLNNFNLEKKKQEEDKKMSTM